QAYRVIKSANTLLEVDTNTDLGLGDGMKAGLVSLAHLFRGMAYGQLALQYNQAPVDVSVEYPVPQPRATVLAEALSALEAARSRLAGVPDADLAGFRTRVIDSPAFDLKNTIDAMLARFYLADGQYANAIAAANRVDLSILSVFRYPSPDRNPIENLAFQALYVAALESFVTDAEAGDDRPAYWVDVGAGSFVGNPDSVMLPLLQYSGANDSYPIYLPDEMKLIKAEALTRTGDLAGAATLVNEVRTQNTSAVDEPVANLGALPGPALDTEAELIAQIAYERRYELFMQGLRWDDTRRLGVAVTTTPTMTFLPTPASECDSNPQSGC
ncbi:MAG: RagB/SusD family nutrient uptake outer membrane protein, partial [Gemmatimonadota bacterium]|nr:RagB/SusD family nutrient uptake outer membrane protein [Gemmatimonadota bacterium]